MSGEVRPFEIRIPDRVLEDLHERLDRTRFVRAIPGSGWEYGVNPGWLHEITDYWRKDFDWRRQEAALNRIPQFITEIDGLDVHFLHQRSKEPEALPLLVTHGWPGSVAEFVKILGPLSDPVAHGGRAADAFHVVCPSLPGYGFSQAPRTPGCDVKRVAEIWIALMQRLGYARYGAQGGDWGAMVNSYVALLDSEHCCGLHLNLVLAARPGDEPAASLSPREQAASRPHVVICARAPPTRRSRPSSPTPWGQPSTIPPPASPPGSSTSSVAGPTAGETRCGVSGETSFSPT
jgi:pimeloyl-ACP methyl ester carboxylesterase